MNTVTFETAKRLEKAGFNGPKKVLKSGDFWYSSLGGLFIKLRGGASWQIADDQPNEKDGSFGPYFAPTATDILKELPGWNLAYTTAHGWIVYPGLADPIQFHHENPAEAAALAWFHEHEKKNESRT